MPKYDPLLTPQEIADELRLKVGTVHAMIRDGGLPCVDLGYRTKRVRRSALDAYLLERERGK